MFANMVRVGAPAKVSHDWGWALPSVVRLLADPEAIVGVPRCPIVRSGVDEFDTALGYWTALDHLLRYQLGWTQPAQGLARWLDAGANELCAPLALVRHLWHADGHLDRYLAWRVEEAGEDLPPPWTRRLTAIHYEWGEQGQPVGPWQLHLEEPGRHALAPIDDPPPADMRIADGDLSLMTKRPMPVIIFDDPAGLECGWYGYLMSRPDSVGPFEVISSRHGPVGKYHRSPHTGYWHTVSETEHRLGNPG